MEQERQRVMAELSSLGNQREELNKEREAFIEERKTANKDKQALQEQLTVVTKVTPHEAFYKWH